MQLDHLSTSIYHNILIIIGLLFVVSYGTKQITRYWQHAHPQKPPNRWWNRLIWLITMGVIIGLGIQIGQVGYHDYQVQTNQYIAKRQLGIKQMHTYQQQITNTQNEITFLQVKINQFGQNDKQIKKKIKRISTLQFKLSQLKTQYKKAQTTVKHIKPNGVPK